MVGIRDYSNYSLSMGIEATDRKDLFIDLIMHVSIHELPPQIRLPTHWRPARSH